MTEKLEMHNPHKNSIDTYGGIKIIFIDHNQWGTSARMSTLDIKLLQRTVWGLVPLQPIFM